MTLDWDQHPEAEAELDAAADWYERRERGVGYELLQATQAAVESTLDPTIQWGYYRGERTEPRSGSLRWKLPGRKLPANPETAKSNVASIPEAAVPLP